MLQNALHMFSSSVCCCQLYQTRRGDLVKLKHTLCSCLCAVNVTYCFNEGRLGAVVWAVHRLQDVKEVVECQKLVQRLKAGSNIPPQKGNLISTMLDAKSFMFIFTSYACSAETYILLLG